MRSTSHTILFLLASAIIISSAGAAVHYVDANSTNPLPPYTTWATAAVTIQDAVDASTFGDRVVVTNGVYNKGGKAFGGLLTNRVTVTIPMITLQSENGPEATVIQGFQVPGTTNGDSAVRCAYLTAGAVLDGFTLTNGATRATGGNDGLGGGVLCSVLGTAPVTLSNCVLTGNVAYQAGGGAYQAILNNCTITGNSARNGGGTSESRLNNCVLSRNAGFLGTPLSRGGGAYGGYLTNCLVVGNTALIGGGIYGEFGYVVNCTILSNSAATGGGISLTIPAGSGLTTISSILRNNSATNGANFYGWDLELGYCCMPDTGGINTITNEPLFVDPANGDFHLLPGSPCINAGRNSFVYSSADLDGNPRIAGGTVDIGAYEFQKPLSVISYGWLQNHDLPTDGSVDFSDSDGDGINNWQEWVTNTDPTNSLSYLHMLAPDGTNNAAGITIHWQSAGMAYLLQRSTNLAGLFTTFATNFFAGVGVATYRDAAATNAGPYFYRVGVQPQWRHMVESMKRTSLRELLKHEDG